MFSGKKNKVHSTFDPPSKTSQQPDHQLSKVLQQVTCQLNLMLELQQQQQQRQQNQQTKTSYDVTSSYNADTMDEYDHYECPHWHREHQETCHGNTSHANFCRNNTRIFQQKHCQQCSVSPSLSSFFSPAHQPQNQCMSICPHDVWRQKRQSCHHHHQPPYGYTSFQQSQCLNSATRSYQQPCYHPQQRHHQCTTSTNSHGPCCGTMADIPTTITSPQSATLPACARSMNVSDPLNDDSTTTTTTTNLNACTSFGQSGYYKDNTPYAPYPHSVRTTTLSTRKNFNKVYTNTTLPPLPGFDPYETDHDAVTMTSNANYDYYADDDDYHPHRRPRQLQRSAPPLFPTFANTTPKPSSTPPPPLPPRTENLSQLRHYQLSWTDIYRQDLLSRQDALISPPVSSYNNINAIHMNKIKKTKSGHSHIRGWWIHGKYKWNQLRKKKFNLCFI